MTVNDEFRPDELVSIQAGVAQFEAHEVRFAGLVGAVDDLAQFWQLGGPPPADVAAPMLREAPPETYVPEAPAEPKEQRPLRRLRDATRAYRRREPAWDLGMTDEFVKAVRDIDRKLQGRILQALSYICAEPTAPRGDTVKPLTGELKGLWRYRIGDYRLVYRPDPQNRRVALVTFVSRGGAYA